MQGLRNVYKRKLQDLIQADRKRGFDLSKAPLFRIHLIHYKAKDYRLIWSQHHILLDGWCLPIVLGDVFKAYEAIKQGRETVLTSRRPYHEYIGWLQQQDMTEAETFWRDYLKDIEGPTRLSFKGMIKEDAESDYSNHIINFSKEESEKLRRYAQDHNLTLNTVIQGAVGLVLQTYTQQSELVMGVTVSGRSIDLPGVEDMVGLFINTLPLKIITNSCEDILSFLKKLQLNMQNLNNYSFTSLAQIQSFSSIKKSLFDVIYVFENYPIGDYDAKKIAEYQIRNQHGIEKTEYPLTILVGPGKQLHINFGYQTEHFNEEIIRRLGEHIKEALLNMVGQSKELHQRALHEIKFLTSEEREQLLVEWNDTKAEYPVDKSIHQLFEEQVEKTPGNIAVIFEDQQLTYQQLNEKSNQLAHYLRNLGVGPDTLVAIAVDRSLDMVVGLLGILKAGGAYVPLDPTYPQERLRFMLEDTQASVLLTQSHLRSTLDSVVVDYCGEIIYMDQEMREGKLSSYSVNNPMSLNAPSHLAYVIYTSGSTGRPKGVLIDHGNFTHYLIHSKLTYPLCDTAAILLHSSIAFDMSITSLFLPIITGNLIRILSADSRFEAIEGIERELNHIDFIKLTPTHLKSLKIELSSQQDVSKHKCFVIGGENLLREDIALWFNDINSPSFSIFNEYGPTEATVGCCVLKINRLEDYSQVSIPIGRPISNTQTYILDSYMNPVPVGVSGEIYIGGAGLARGYLNRPDLTADRFVPNPFITEQDLEDDEDYHHTSLRLYRTGDLARYLPDGNIEFLGRIDDQVKIRGFRIELGEIESSLSQHGDVSQAFVMAREDKSGHKKLVTYVVPGEFTPSATELKDFLADKLPEYMVPSFFVFLDKLPLTPNGKIDRKALPAPDTNTRSLGSEYVAPQTPIQEELAQIWSEVLKVKQIGIHDNFFRIGGDSIISIQLVSKARQKGIYFAVKDVFNHPTISALAAVAKTQEETLALKPDQHLVEGDVPLTPIQHWFFEQDFPVKDHFNQAMLFYPSEQRISFEILEQAIGILVSHHDALRLRYEKVKSKSKDKGKSKEAQRSSWKQVCVGKENHKICSVIDLSLSSDESLLSDLDKEGSIIQQSLSIEQGPLIKVALFECGAHRPQRLLIAIHHLAVDGVSWRILLEDLERIYDSLSRNESPVLLPKTHSYQQWSNSLQAYADSKELGEEKEYWQGVEGSIKPLPVDFEEGEATGESTKFVSVSLSEEVR